jgi:hypothetical protein
MCSWKNVSFLSEQLEKICFKICDLLLFNKIGEDGRTSSAWK